MTRETLEFGHFWQATKFCWPLGINFTLTLEDSRSDTHTQHAIVSVQRVDLYRVVPYESCADHVGLDSWRWPVPAQRSLRWAQHLERRAEAEGRASTAYRHFSTALFKLESKLKPCAANV